MGFCLLPKREATGPEAGAADPCSDEALLGHMALGALDAYAELRAFLPYPFPKAAKGKDK